MKKRALFFILPFLLPLQPTFPQPPSKPRIGVLQFSAKNVSATDADAAGELFTSELVMTGIFDVVDRKNIQTLLSEVHFQLSGCTDSSCAVEVGRILSLEYMISGSVIKLGRTLAINIQMIDVETAQIVHTVRKEFRTIEDTYKIIPKLVRQFIKAPGISGNETGPPAGSGIYGLSKRQKLGTPVFWSGVAAVGASVPFFIWAVVYNTATVRPAYADYVGAGFTDYEELKEVYLEVFGKKAGIAASALTLAGSGAAAITAGILLRFLPERQKGNGNGTVDIAIVPIPCGAILSFSLDQEARR